ncbi:MAG: hypothetical protein K9I94_09705 [Bacteroidales bacterium]|nr:hypothetical protein [Bacteroidales bacterium]
MEEFKLELYKHDQEIIQATRDQILKDFNMVGLHLQLPDAKIGMYNDLLDLLSRQLYILIEKDQEGLYNLLYRVDIKASAIHKAKHTSEYADDAEMIASMIIYRAFEKVMLRRYFSNH